MRRVPMFTVRPSRPALSCNVNLRDAGHEDAHGPTWRIGMGGVPPAEISAGMKCRGEYPVWPEGTAKLPRPNAQSGQRVERQFQRRQYQCQQ